MNGSNGICVICGKEFSRIRVSKTTCSDACRKTLSRQNIEKKGRVRDYAMNASWSIEALAILLKDDDFDSYEIMLRLYSLNSLISTLTTDSSSVWECRECGMIKTTDLPVANSCYCETSQWVLQKRMI